MIEELKKLDGQKIKYLQKRNPELVEWIMNKTIEMPDISLAERIYRILNGEKIIPCKHGNKKRFESFTIGYKFCSMNCTCQIEFATMKRKQTNLERYGVENPFQSEEKKEKIKRTSFKKYGTEHHLQNSHILEKQKKTNVSRYGVTNPLQNSQILEKQKLTIMERYGVENIGLHVDTKEKVKLTNLEKFGTEFASQNSEIKEKVKQTNLERYQVEYISQNSDIQNKIKQTNIERYGVERAAQNLEIKEKAKQTNIKLYNRNYYNQHNISDNSFIILQNEMELVELLKTKSITEVSMLLNVSYPTIQRYCKKYNIDIPSSTYETAICSFLKEHNIEYQLHNRKLISPLEIDIVLPDYNIGIEFCGLYWHSECIQPDKKYHLNKLKQMNVIGYKLLTIFEDEWLFKRDIVERRLLYLLRLSEKGKGARKLDIKQIDWQETKDFLDTYHIQGAGVPGYAKYGAFDDSELVAVMTFSKPRLALGKKKDSDIFDELLRFVTNGKNYPGIASRLMKTFIKEYNPAQIISYADRRWSEGNLYKQLGFEMIPETNDVNYWHVKGTQRHYRFNFRKDKIKHLVENGEFKTEVEIMRELGYSRIWDCGTLKFIWNAS